MNLFDSVQVRTIGLKEAAAEVPLLVEVVEKKPYFFEVGGGYETDKGLFARTRIGDGKRKVRQAFLRTDGHNRLRLRVQAHVVTARVPVANRLAQSRNSLGHGVTMGIGAIGGFGANHHLRQSLVFLNVQTLQQPEAYVGNTGTLFDEEGRVKNEATASFLRNFAQAFDRWIEKQRG